MSRPERSHLKAPTSPPPARSSSRPSARRTEQRRALATADRAGTQLYDAVTAARGAGMPWLVIAHALGVTVQAAQQRFSKPCRRQHT